MAKLKMLNNVPAAEQENYQRLTALTDAFCSEHLNEGYAELARSATAALCRKRPSPLRSGRANGWACGVIYAIGQVNYLFDKDSDPYMPSAELCAHFNIAAGTGGSKAKQVREAVGIQQYGFQWALPETIDRVGSLFWLIEYDGLAVDARELSRDVQEAAFEKGLIPYVYADKGKTEVQIAEGKEVRARYDLYREIASHHQTRLGGKLIETTVPDVALRLGLIETAGDLSSADVDDIVPAIDIALYELDSDGMNALARDLEEWPSCLDKNERPVFNAMSQSRFSVFEVTGKHAVAGITLRDLFTGDELWLIDRSLEASAPPGLRIALRLIRPDAFWMATGVLALLDDETWKTLERRFADSNKVAPHPDQLAEFTFQILSEKQGPASVAA